MAVRTTDRLDLHRLVATHALTMIGYLEFWFIHTNPSLFSVARLAWRWPRSYRGVMMATGTQGFAWTMKTLRQTAL